MTSTAPSFAMVLGLSPTGLYVIRELGQAGIRVMGADANIQAGYYSKYLYHGLTPIADDEPERFIAQLIEIAQKEGQRGVLIPSSDTYIETIVRYAQQLSPYFEFQTSYNTHDYTVLVDKTGFAQLCDDHHIDTPAQWVIAGSELLGLRYHIPYPCLIKPAFIHIAKRFMKGNKSFIIKDMQAFDQIANKLKNSASPWLIQEIIPGPESNITLFGGYFSKNNQLQQAFTARKLRQFPPGFGSASWVKSEVLEETLCMSKLFLNKIGFTGIASVEFKYDTRAQKLKIIEINPRPALWYALSHAANKRIALAAFYDLSQHTPPPEQPQNQDIAWRYLLKDTASFIIYRTYSHHFILPEPQLRPVSAQTIGPLFDRHDLRPLWGEFINYTKKALSAPLR